MSYQAEITENSCGNFQESIESLKKKEKNGVLLLKNRGKVFDRIEIESPGARVSNYTYNLVIGMVLAWGLSVDWLLAKNLNFAGLVDFSMLGFMGGCFTACCCGIVLLKKSIRPLSRFFGYNLVVVPLGVAVQAAVQPFDPSAVTDALRVAALATLTMTCFGVLLPRVFEKVTGALSTAVFSVVAVAGVEILLLQKQHHGIGLLFVLVFCSYIGIDWGRANSIPKTIANAVDSAAAVYMDIINLFLGMFHMPAGRNRRL